MVEPVVESVVEPVVEPLNMPRSVNKQLKNRLLLMPHRSPLVFLILIVKVAKRMKVLRHAREIQNMDIY